jgi:PAS domain S-box-containing protein
MDRNYNYIEKDKTVDFLHHELPENYKNYDSIKKNNLLEVDKKNHQASEEYQQHKVRELEQEKIILSELHDDQSTQLNELQMAHLKLEEQFKEIIQLREVLDQAAIITIIDRHNKITHVNKKFTEISKYSENELIGETHPMLKSEFHNEYFFENIFTIISRGHIWSGEIKDRKKDRTIYYIKYSIIPFYKNETIIKYIFVGMDISKEKELQKKLIESQRLSAIGELSARIAHDIRNPLSVIQMTMELLQTKNKGKELDVTFQRINDAIKRITHQVEDVLDHVTPKPLILKEEKIGDIIQHALEDSAIPKGVTVNIHGDDITLICDTQKLQVVFTNLIINAIQAMNKIGVITISCISDKKNTIIKISDTGPGIPDELLADRKSVV